VKINEKMIRKLIGNMCKGLIELHSTDIFHLNIKPGIPIIERTQLMQR
jgi:serine/threonine protein kinase